VYTIAEKYDIPKLKSLAYDKYKESLGVDKPWDSASFVSSLEHLYEWLPKSDRMIKDVALKTVRQELFELYKVPEFVSLYDTNKNFGRDFLDMIVKSDADDLAEESNVVMVERISSCYTAPSAVGTICGYYGQGFWCGGCGSVFPVGH
jgi:hypothetical protein